MQLLKTKTDENLQFSDFSLHYGHLLQLHATAFSTSTHQNSAVGLFLLVVSEDLKQVPLSVELDLRKKKKVAWCVIWWIGRVVKYWDAFLGCKVLQWECCVSWCVVSQSFKNVVIIVLLHYYFIGNPILHNHSLNVKENNLYGVELGLALSSLLFTSILQCIDRGFVSGLYWSGLLSLVI